MDVFVVRHFYEDAPETRHLGVWTTFEGAAKGIIADFKNEHEFDKGEPYTLVADPNPPGDEVWFEECYDKRPGGTYWTVTKMELTE